MEMYENKEPYVVELKARDSTWICTCGQTKKAPYCDGSHQKVDGARGPEEIGESVDSTFYIGGCGNTGKGIFCDGTHAKK